MSVESVRFVEFVCDFGDGELVVRSWEFVDTDHKLHTMNHELRTVCSVVRFLCFSR